MSDLDPVGYPATLDVEYLSTAELAACPAEWWTSVLGVVPFGARAGFECAHDIPVAPVALKVLDPAGASFEVWRLNEPLRSGRLGLVHYRAGRSMLFGRVVIAEREPPVAAEASAAVLQRATADAYGAIFSALQHLGYPYLLRVWNYVAAINAEDLLGERYRQFNTARRQAFLVGQRAVEGEVPAACALGSELGSPLVIYFIASSTPARAIENPRQVSAYRYPREYGPDSPTFSRAAISAHGTEHQLFISGTASIIGHRTAHAGDAGAQARESAANIAALIEAANVATGSTAYSADALKYKVYVRNESDFPVIRSELLSGLRADLPITYLQADICRSDLLVEIEAWGRASNGSAARL